MSTDQISSSENLKNLGTLSTIAKMTDTSIYTLRFYVKEKILVPIQIQDNGYKLFNIDHSVKVILFIQKAKKINLTLNEIRDLLNIHTMQEPCHSVISLLKDKIDQAQIEIQNMQTNLDFMKNIHQKWIESPHCQDSDRSNPPICSLIDII